MENELISLIIPAYNMDRYIARCVESVIAQTYSNWELIIVNDGSTDNTQNIARKYTSDDRRIKLYNNKNQGVCKTRNYGISVASGEWFGFIDADDWLEPTFLEILYKNAVENNCSISACRFINDYGDGVIGADERVNNVALFRSSNECIHNFICDGMSMEGMVWNKIYRTELYREYRFDSSIRVNEDCKYTFELMSQCENACLTSAKLYHYYLRRDSASRGRPKKIELDNAMVFLDLLDKTKHIDDVELKCKLKAEYVNIIMKMLTNVKYAYDNDQLKNVRERLICWRDDVWPIINSNTKKYYDLAIYYPKIMNTIRVKNCFIEDTKYLLKKSLIFYSKSQK